MALLSEQHQSLEGLVDIYCRMYGIEGPLETDQVNTIVNEQPAEVCERFVLTHESAIACMDALGV